MLQPHNSDACCKCQRQANATHLSWALLLQVARLQRQLGALVQLLLRTLTLSHNLLRFGQHDAGTAMDVSCQAMQQLVQLDLVLRRTCEKLVRPY